MKKNRKIGNNLLVLRLTKLSVLIILLTTFLGCENNTENEESITLSDSILTSEKIEKEFYTVRKHFVVGDFDGDGKMDTLFEQNYSKLTGTEIDSFLCTDDWEPFFDWFYAQKPDLRLTFNKKGRDTLHLGENLGLFCLINIGDNNSDGKDEIAIAINSPRMAGMTGMCEIYSLCNNKWVMLKEFSIHYDPFYFYEGDEKPVFKEIKEYLEKHKGKWFYLDDLDQGWDTPEEVGKMKPLKLEKCK